jgi:hypothetical protein
METGGGKGMHCGPLLFDHIDITPLNSNEVNVIYEDLTDYRRSPQGRSAPPLTLPAVHAALDDVLDSGNVNVKIFRFWAPKVKAACFGGFILGNWLAISTSALACRAGICRLVPKADMKSCFSRRPLRTLHASEHASPGAHCRGRTRLAMVYGAMMVGVTGA